MKEKSLILYYNSNSYYFSYVRDEEIDLKCVYRKTNGIFKVLAKLPVISSVTYGEWKKEIKQYKKVIIFDNAYNENLFRYIKKERSNENVYVYSWNSAINSKQRTLLEKANKYFPVYSFDKKDCAKYNFKYAPMVYSKDIVKLFRNKNEKPIYDVLFVGWDKGRTEELYTIYRNIKKMGGKAFFLIKGERRSELETSEFKFTKTFLSYEEYLRKVCQSKVLINIQQEGQEGLTIRMVEALFFEKKVITNKIDIDTYDFYDENNILIMDKNYEEKLQQFIDRPYKPVNKKILKKYDLEYWAKNYFKPEDINN